MTTWGTSPIVRTWLLGEGAERDPEFRATPLTGFLYPDVLGSSCAPGLEALG